MGSGSSTTKVFPENISRRRRACGQGREEFIPTEGRPKITAVGEIFFYENRLVCRSQSVESINIEMYKECPLTLERSTIKTSIGERSKKLYGTTLLCLSTLRKMI